MIVALIIISTILTITAATTSYLYWVTQKKCKAAIKYAEWYAGFIYVALQKIKDVKMEMDIIDSRGSFKADDEVGYTFEALHEVIKDLDVFIKKNLEEVD